MKRNPITLYDNLILETRQHLRLKSDEMARKRLGVALRNKSPERWALDLLDRHGIGIGYVLNHLLSVGAWQPNVREAIQNGLSLATARKVANLNEPALEAEALEVFHASTGLSLVKRSRLVEQAVLGLRAQLERQEYALDAAGWLPP